MHEAGLRIDVGPLSQVRRWRASALALRSIGDEQVAA
jgi:hypothetical protein